MRLSARAFSIIAILILVSGVFGVPQKDVQAASDGIVISQVYGGGGEIGTTWKNDYIELYNRGLVAVDVTGWSVQFTHQDETLPDTYWYKTDLSGVIQPGEYFLIQEGNGAGLGTTNLPTPDITDVNPIYALHGKVALVNNNVLLTGSCPAGVVDFLGFGTDTNCYETSVFPSTTLSHTNAAFRKNGGCTDTDNNALDFEGLLANPRNSASTRHYCVSPTDPSGIGSATPSTVSQGGTALLEVAVTGGDYPPSTGLGVTCDLTAVGGSASQMLYDNGLNGDAVSGDNTFSRNTIMTTATTGVLSLPCTISDAEGRSVPVSIDLTIEPPPPDAFSKISPTDAAIGQSLAPTLSWAASTGATSYSYCYDTSNDNVCAPWVDNGTITSVALSGLSLGTTYYWQVKADNSYGTTYADGSLDTFWSFTTGNLPGAFSKSSPTNTAMGQSLTPTLSWGTSTGATSYSYCYDTSNDNACASWVDNGTTTSVALSGLAPGATYYWQVKADNSFGTTYANGSLGAFWSFTTGNLPGVFSKSLPANLAVGQSLAPTLSWAASTGATSYLYCYDTITGCTNWVDNGTEISVPLSGLAAGTTYYWQVKAVNSYGETIADSGAYWSFNTGAVPGAFSKTSPNNAAIGQSLTPTLSWAGSTGATSYSYCYDTSNDNACAPWVDNGTTTSVALSGLAPGTTYYWQVKAVNIYGETIANGGAYWSFNTGDAPGAFSKTAPTNAAIGQSLAPTLSWGTSTGATSYSYCYATATGCTTWVLVGTSKSASLSPLALGTIYYWQVKADNAFGTTYANGGTYWSFTTGNLPGVFSKSQPANLAVGQSLTPALSWAGSTGATSYSYCYDTSNDNACAPWVGNGMNTSVTLSGLTLDTTYYWQVKADNSFGTTYANGSLGTFWSFTTGNLPGAFSKTSPTNTAIGQSLTPTLNWGVSTGATSYSYCYDTSNDNACAPWVDNGTTTSVALGELALGTTYYWQVKAENSYGTTYANGGTYWSFNTDLLPAAFGKTAPVNHAIGQPNTPTLSWAASTGATSYSYCFDTSNDNACAPWVNNDTKTSVTLGELALGTTYYWQVKAENSYGTTYANGSLGTFWSFTTGNLPGTFVKNSPNDTSTIQSPTPTLSWEASTGAASYSYCYATTTGCINWVDNGTKTSVSPIGLVPDTTYYWQVKAFNNYGETIADGGAYWSFDFYTFADVLPGSWYYRYVEGFYAKGITSGCSTAPFLYCPDSAVTRAQMAVFLLKAEHGSDFVPPLASGSLFSDVPVSYWAGAWIEQLAAEGITTGCGAGMYCPQNPVTRAQMAVFILKAEHGKAYVPPPASGVFGDVPVDYWAAAWIEQLAAEGITTGCSTNPLNYCPARSVTRAQMAVFIDKAFGFELLP